MKFLCWNRKNLVIIDRSIEMLRIIVFNQYVKDILVLFAHDVIILIIKKISFKRHYNCFEMFEKIFSLFVNIFFSNISANR